MTSAADELYELLHLLAEQELTCAQLERLEQLVIENPELRRRYLLFCQWHAAVERYGLPPLSGDASGEWLEESDAALTDPGATGRTASAPSEQAAPPCPAPLAPPGATWPAGLPLGSWGTLLTLAALLVTLSLFGYWTLSMRARSLPPVAANNSADSRERAAAAYDAPFVATLIDSADCEWGQVSQKIRENSRLASGWLLLASGMAAIRFDCGSTVLLQGPAEFALTSAACGTLRSGRLVSKSPQADSGFTILTGNSEIIDQGTEFGVLADASGSTEIHVFDGVAKVRQRGVLHGATPERFLKAGQATRFDVKPAGAAHAPTSRLDGPVGITFGPDGDLYVASRFSDSILLYSGRTGALLRPFVPSQSGGLNNPFFLAFGPDGHLYVSSTGNHAVLRFDGQTGASLGEFVPPRSGGVAGPMGLAFDREGNLYVASSGKQTVCRFEGRTGAPLGPFFAPGSGGLNGPTGITFGPDGDLWVADRNRDCVLRYAGETGAFVERLTFDGQLKFPFDVAFDAAGDLYVASHANDRVLRMDLASRQARSGVDERQAPAWPHALAFGPDRRLYCTSDSANAVMRYETPSGEFVDAFVVSWQDLQADPENFVLQMPDRVNLNTGLSRGGKAMRPGEHCPRWFIEKCPDPRFICPGPAVVTAALPGWDPNSRRSSWLSIAPLREDYRAASGRYVFYAGFELGAQDLPNARLLGKAWSPHQLIEVQLNKRPARVDIQQHAGGSKAELVIDEGFVAGLNFVYFIVQSDDEGPTAFRAELDLVRNRHAVEQAMAPEAAKSTGARSQ